MKNEIILYRPNELAAHIEVRLDEETVWLTQAQLATLFNQTKQNMVLPLTVWVFFWPQIAQIITN